MASRWGAGGETPVLAPESVYTADWEHGERTDRIAGLARYSIHEDAWPRPHAPYAEQAALAALDPSCGLAVAASLRALPDAWRQRIDASRIRVQLATLALPSRHAAGWAAQVLAASSQRSGMRYRAFDRFAAAAPASAVAQALGLRGGSLSLDAACASSIYSVAYACDALASRRCDAALAGGVGAADPLYLQMGFSQLGALSRSGHCRPLDARADGLVVGEGACVLALRRLDDALREGEDVLAVIRGVGLCNDRAGKLLAPSHEGQLRAMHAAYAGLELTPSSVGHVECHATGTPTGDAVEVQSVREFFSATTRSAAVAPRSLGATKACVGHLLTGAGAMGITAAVLAVRSETRPPVAGLQEPSAALLDARDVVCAGAEARAWELASHAKQHGRVAAVNAFGFGGTNAHLLVQETEAALAAAPRGTQVSLSRPDAADEGSPDLATHHDRAQTDPTWHSAPLRIAVTGVAIRLGDCDDREANTLRLMGLAEGVPKQADPRLGRGEVAGAGDFLDEISLPQGRYKIPPRELTRAQAQQILLLEAARAAVLDAETGLSPQALVAPAAPADSAAVDPSRAGPGEHGGAAVPSAELSMRTGCFLGIELEIATTDHHLRWQREADAPASPDLAAVKDRLGPALDADRVLGGLGSIVASRVARELALGGASHTVSCDEVSGLAAIELAVHALGDGGALDRAIVGAGDLMQDPRTRAALDSLLDLRGDAGDLSREPLALQDCACVWVLEREADAVAAGRKIYATITGVSLSHGGELGKPGTDVDALQGAVDQAMAQAGCNAGDIEHIESTMVQRVARDHAERRVLAALSRARRDAIAKQTKDRVEYSLADLRASLGAVATDLGYAGAATGMLAATRALLCLHHVALPASRCAMMELSGRVAGPSSKRADRSRALGGGSSRDSSINARDELWSTDARAILDDRPDAVVVRRCQPWLTADASAGRRALVTATGLGGGAAALVLCQAPQGLPAVSEATLGQSGEATRSNIEPLRTTEREVLLLLSSDHLAGLEAQLREVEACSTDADALASLAGRLCADFDRSRSACMTMVIRDGDAALSTLDAARTLLAAGVGASAHGGRVSLRVGPPRFGASPQLAFVFPGSGSQFAGMGAEILLRAPWLLEQQATRYGDLRVQQLGSMIWNASAETLAQDKRAMIIAHVSLATLISDLAIWLGLRPNAAIGYSLGESAGLFALGAWTQRAAMLQRVACSDLFVNQLAGKNQAAATFWASKGLIAPEDLGGASGSANTPNEGDLVANWHPEWLVGVVAAGRVEVEQARDSLGLARTYLLIVNTDDECVIGGLASETRALVDALGKSFVELQGVSTVHCEVLSPVADDYRQLHVQPTRAPEGVLFYVGSQAEPIVPTTESSADAILANAREGIDWPRTVRQAYADGVRVFLEIGPGASCSRMINKLGLGDRSMSGRGPGRTPDDASPLAIFLLPATRTPWAALLTAIGACCLEGVEINAQRLAFLMRGGTRDQRRTTDAKPHAQRSALAARSTGGEPASITVPVGHRLRGSDDADGESILRPTTHPSSLKSRSQMISAQATGPAQDLRSPSRGVAHHDSDGVELARADVTPAPMPAIAAAQTEPSWAQQGTRAARGETSDRLSHATRLSSATYSAHLEWMNFARTQMDAIEALLGGRAIQPNSSGSAGASQPPLAAATWVRDAPGLPSATPRPAASVTLPHTATVSAPTPRPVPAPSPGATSHLHGLRSNTLSRAECLAYASRSLSQSLGPAFVELDSIPTRVRLPAPPLMLVDRVDSITLGEAPLSSGTLATEHDVRAGAWYLDANRICTSVAIESGQADLMLAGFLGIDRVTSGGAVYRLLDATVEFYGALPRPGETIRYEIAIERFFLQGGTAQPNPEGGAGQDQSATHLFRFHFDATVAGRPLMSMRDGCAGFFTPAQLDAGKGIVESARRLRPPALFDRRLDSIGVSPSTDSSAVGPRGGDVTSRLALDAAEVEMLARGQLGELWGRDFALATPEQPVTLPRGPLRLIHAVESIDLQGGRYGIGRVVATTEIDPEAWFITCHFVDDPVMPGTLMYECCLQALRVLLLRRGVILDARRGDYFGPRAGVRSQLKCRGQVLQDSVQCRWEIDVQTLAIDDVTQEVYAIADARMLVDGKAIVEVERMSVQAFGCAFEEHASRWAAAQSGRALPSTSAASASAIPRAIACPWAPPEHFVDELTRMRLEEFADGSVVRGLGPAFAEFDAGRFIARLPRSPFLFIDHAWICRGEQTGPKAGASAVAVLQIDRADPRFADLGQAALPFSYLLEIALQPCGMLSAWTGSALSSKQDLRFRNLGGEATVLAAPSLPLVLDSSDWLRIEVTLTASSQSAGMMIQHYEYRVESALVGDLYQGTTYFGFFTNDALAAQRGLTQIPIEELVPDRDIAQGNGVANQGRATSTLVPRHAPFPSDRMRMVDEILALEMTGGPHGLGFAVGAVNVDPDAWFFRAHFRDDPVWPGSLGLEGVVQLLACWSQQRWASAAEREAGLAKFELAASSRHRWVYRGQIVPGATRVRIDLVITSVDDLRRRVAADAVLRVDGRAIYEVRDLEIECAVPR